MLDTDPSSDAILYGQAGARDPIFYETEQMVKRADGVIEHFGMNGKIYKVIIPENTSYRVEAPYPGQYPDLRENDHRYLSGCTIYIDADHRLHNPEGPAVIKTDGQEEYWRHGLRDRSDGPAITSPDGHWEYWQAGRLHRNPDISGKTGPAVKRVRDGDPAPRSGLEWWWAGKRHRNDGPALIGPDGEEKWYWRGELCSKRKWRQLRRRQAKRGRRWIFR